MKKLKKDGENIDGILHHERLLFMLEIIYMELISCHYNNLLADHFGIEKI